MLFEVYLFIHQSLSMNLSRCFREDLRKWFLSMETALFRHRFRLESPEAQVGFIHLMWS